LKAALTIDHSSPARGLLRQMKIRIDPAFHGELKRLQSDATIRKSFFSQNGLSIDEVGRRLHDAGYLSERPSPAEVVDILAEILPAGVPPKELIGIPIRIAEVLIDGRERTQKEIQRALRFDTDRCICRDIRRLRSKTYGGLEVPVSKRRGKWFYKLTVADIAKVKALLPRCEEVAV